MARNSTKSEWDLPAMRAWSNLVFGSPHRLPVAVLSASAEPGELYAQRIAKAVGTDVKEARRLLSDLQRAKVLQSVDAPAGPRGRGRPPKHLWRCDDQFWGYIQKLGERYRRPAATSRTLKPPAPPRRPPAG
jgi:hypothetical protein